MPVMSSNTAPEDDLNYSTWQALESRFASGDFHANTGPMRYDDPTWEPLEPIYSDEASATNTVDSEPPTEQPFESELEDEIPSDFEDESLSMEARSTFFDLENAPEELLVEIEDPSIENQDIDSNLDSDTFQDSFHIQDMPSSFWYREDDAIMVQSFMFRLGGFLNQSIEDEDPQMCSMDPGSAQAQPLHPESLRKGRFYCQLMIASAFQVTQGHPEEAEAFYYRNKVGQVETLASLFGKLSSIANNWGVRFRSFVYKIDLLPAEVQAEFRTLLVAIIENFQRDLDDDAGTIETEKAVLSLFSGLATWVTEVCLLLIQVKNQFVQRDERLEVLRQIVTEAPQQENLLAATRALVNGLDEDNRKCMICLDEWKALELPEEVVADHVREDDYPADYQADNQPWLSVDESLCTLAIKEPFETIQLKMPCGHIFCAGCINTWMNTFNQAVQCPFRDMDLGVRQLWEDVLAKYAFLSRGNTPNGGFVEANAHEAFAEMQHLENRSHIARLQKHEEYVHLIGVAFGPVS